MNCPKFLHLKQENLNIEKRESEDTECKKQRGQTCWQRLEAKGEREKVHRKKMHRHLVKQKYAHKIIRRDVWYHDIRKQWYNVASIRCFIFSTRRNFRICFHRLSATLFLYYSTQTKEKASSVLKMMDIIVWWYQLTKNRNEIKCKRSTYIRGDMIFHAGKCYLSDDV